MENTQFFKVMLIISMLLFSSLIYGQTFNWDSDGNQPNTTEFIGTTNLEDLRFKANNNNRLTLTTDGLLFLGKQSILPTSLLTLFDKGSDVKILFSNRPDDNALLNGNFLIGLNAQSSHARINQVLDANLSLFTNNTERITILGNGKIGINNTNPLELLDISGGVIALRQGASNKFVLTSDASGVATWQAIEIGLNLTTNILNINGVNSVDLSNYLDNTDNQDLSLSGNILSLTNDATTVDLSPYLDNTDTQLTDIEISTMGYIKNANETDPQYNAWNKSYSDLTYKPNIIDSISSVIDTTTQFIRTEIDGDSTNELQTLSISNDTVFLSNGGFVVLPSIDSLGISDLGYVAGGITTEIDGSITNELQTIDLQGTTLTLSQNNSSVDLGNLNYWNKNSSNQLSYNVANVGIGLETPCSNLQIHSNEATGSPSGGLSHISIRGAGREDISASKSNLLLTNKNSGKTCTDGLLIESNSNNGKVQLQEKGNLMLFANNNKGIIIDNEGRVKLNSFQVASSPTRMLVVDRYGIVSTQNTNAYNDNLGDHTATQDLNMNGKNILGGTTVENTGEKLSIYQNNNPRNSAYIDMYGTNHSTANSRGSMSFVTNGTTGDFAFTNFNTNNSSWERKMTLKSDGTLNINNLAGTNERVLIADNIGNISASIELDSIRDNLGDHNATQDIEMDGNAINLQGSSHGLKFYGEFSTDEDGTPIQISAPVLYGWNGGMLGSIQDGNEKLALVWNNKGNVGIGTTADWNYKLVVKGTAHFCKVIAEYDGWCDFVFDKNYNLMELTELETFIKKNKHLPEIPTDTEVQKNGVDLGEMNTKLLQKVEELTLYIISQNKRITELERRIK